LYPLRISRRRLGAGLTGLLLAAATLVAAPAAIAASDGDHGSYERLPVLVRDWTRANAPEVVEREGERLDILNRRWREVHDLVGGHHVSRLSNELLRRRGLGPALAADGADKAAAYDGVDTLQVLLVRISFDSNRDPHLTTIPADGDFMLTAPADPEPIPIDPPPHNKAFFEAHMAGLSEYYRFQSGGRLHIEGRVLPDDPEGSYKLSDIADYGPGATGSWTLETLEILVRDMILAADAGAAGDGVNLGDYDDDNPFTYIIFVHSGSDWQSDIYGDSPNDIPTFFISLGEPQALANGSLSECSIIPETTTQDGWPGSIAAAFYHEFGHALGLPDVYSTRTGLPSVGIWDLMDSGTNLQVQLAAITDEGDTVSTLATGVLPPSLSAWCRWFLGWLEVEEMDSRVGDIYLPASAIPRDQYALYRTINPAFRDQYPQALRCGLSPREWFLAENRWVPAGPWETPYNELYFERDENTGVIQYLTGERNGVWQNTGLYDYFMPAGGVLLWHVNMDRIESGLADNTVNYYGDGLRLVEADGIQDVGFLDGYVLGWYGSAWDPFGGYTFDFEGNRLENDFRSLFAEGYPSSRGYDRSWTGVTLADVRLTANAGVMVMNGAIDGVLPGFPWEAAVVDSAQAAEAGGGIGARGVLPASLVTMELGGAPVLIFGDAAPDGWTGPAWRTGLFGLTQVGVPRWGSAAGRPLGEFARLSAPLAGAPAAWNEADGSGRLLCGSVDGAVTLFNLPSSGQPTVAWSLEMDSALAHAPRILRDGNGDLSAFVVTAGGLVMRLDPADGAVTGSVSAYAGDPGGEPRVLPDPFGDRLVVFHGAGVAIVDNGTDLAVSAQWAYPREAEGGLQTAAAGGTDPLLAAWDDQGLLGAWDPSGTPAEAPDPEEALAAEPAVADLDGDGRQDLVLVTPRRVMASALDGTALRGFPAPLYEMFPLPDTTRLAGPAVVADLDGDGLAEVVTTTDGGHMLSLTAEGRLRDRFPLRWGDRAAAGFAIGPEETAGAGRVLWLASAGGYAGEPFGRQLTGGRISALRLASPAAVASSEWLASGGGPARGGPVGELRDLGGLSPSADELGRIILYPNPVSGSEVTVRLGTDVDGTARLVLYDLQGEPVTTASFDVSAGNVSEHTLALPSAATGLYVCVVQVPTAAGSETRTLTLAVER
jgi:M6 family metalloprotease-like protein